MSSLYPQDAAAADSEDAVVIRPGRKPRSNKKTDKNKNAAPETTIIAAAENEEEHIGATDNDNSEQLVANTSVQEAEASPAMLQQNAETDPEIFNIEKIIKHRRVGRGFQFLVKWENFPDSENKWIPTSYFANPDIPQAYLRSKGIETGSKKTTGGRKNSNLAAIQEEPPAVKEAEESRRSKPNETVGRYSLRTRVRRPEPD